MKILYTGRLAAWTTTEARMRALNDLGHTLVQVDALPYLHRGSRFLAKVQIHFLTGPNVMSYNHALIRAVDRERPEMIWVDSGLFVWPSTLRKIRAMTSVPIIHYHSDDIESEKLKHRHYLAGLRYYDLNVTTNENNIPGLVRLGSRKVMRGEFGYDPVLHRRVIRTEEEQYRYGADLTFIGHWEPSTEHTILALLDHGLQVRLWGGGWHRARDRRLRTTAAIYGEEYVRALASAKICLCFLSKWNRNQSAGRTFEIPAIGGFLLAERTKDHQRYYLEGQEAEFFEGQVELLAKARHYLADANRREEIARAGHARCLASGYSHQDRVRQILEYV